MDNTKQSEYRIWQNMRQRCSNPKATSYAYYGGRGIEVYPQWEDFAHFLADMGPRPTPEHTLDRIDSDKNYSPSNCRWATRREQVESRKSNPLNRHRAYQIRYFAGLGFPRAKLAEAFNISINGVGKVLNDQRWS